MVRQITESEEIKATGSPWTSIGSTFGATQGFMYYLRYTGQTVSSNWMAAPGSPKLFLGFVGAGLVGGWAVSRAVFGDAELSNLVSQHASDKSNRIEAQKFVQRN